MLAVAGSVQAQTATDKPPYYKTISPDTEWLIKVTPVQKVEGRPTFKEIKGSRSASLRHEVISWGNFETERWLAGNFLLETLPGERNVIPTPYPKKPEEIERRLAEFPELNWLVPENQKGTVEVDGKLCRYYARTIVVKPEIDGEGWEQIRKGELEMPKDIIYNYQAWIDAATGLPVAYESSDYRYEYEFMPSKGRLELSLPDRFLQSARMIDPKFTP